WAATGRGVRGLALLVTEAPHTAQSFCPAPMIAPQLRHIVGRPALEFSALLFDEVSGKTHYTNKRDACQKTKHHAQEPQKNMSTSSKWILQRSQPVTQKPRRKPDSLTLRCT